MVVFLLALMLMMLASRTEAIKVFGYGINITVWLDQKDILALGERAAKQIEDENKVVKDSTLQKRVDEVAKAAGADRKHPVKILESSEVNAFCTFDSRIYVNTGLLKLVTDDELFFVLAHESVHGIFQDPENHFKERLRFQLALKRAGVVTEGGLEKLTAALITGIAEGAYSRKQERNADRFGCLYLFTAKKNVSAATSVMEKFLKLRGGKKPHGLSRYFLTHPPEEKRIAQFQKWGAEWAAEESKLSPQIPK